MEVICPVCSETLDVAETDPSVELDCPRCGSVFATLDATVVDSQEALRSYAAAAELWDRLVPTAGPRPRDLPDIAGYEVLEFVARGGHGVVLKARHKALDRLVAIKMLLPQKLASQADRERFLREARSAARLRHANICPIYEVAEHEGCPYIAMGYIQGPTLRKWAKTGQPSAMAAAEMVAKLARAVDYAHEHGVIHRDIKPDNVMVEADRGQPVLTDFGLAKELTDQDGRVTRAGTVIGTPAYMAPEQAAGRLEQIGPATDVYALGAILYEFLCGSPPFLGSAGEIVKKVQTEEPVPPRKIAPRIHRDLETICLKALAKRPEGRYASAVALAEDLERFSSGEAILARRQPLAAKVLRSARRNPVTATAVTAAVLAILLVGVSVHQAVRIRGIANVSQAFEAALDRRDWTRAHLGSTESLLAELERFSPEQSAGARERLYERFGEYIRGEIRRPTLSEEDFSRIGALVDALAERRPAAAGPVRQALEQRRRGWRVVFDLKAPFAELDSVMDAGDVHRQGTELACRAPGKKPGQPNILTRLACEGNVKLEARFTASWRRAGRIGLALNTTTAAGYAFLVAVAESKRTPDGGRTPPGTAFSAAAQGGALVALRILRDGIVLREKLLPPGQLSAGELRLTARREADRLSLRVNDLAPVVFQDIFPLRGAKPGTFALYWPEEARLVHLRGSRQHLPVAPSALEHGDDLYTRGDFAEALEQYHGQALVAADEEFRQEARYKEALCLVALQRSEEAAQILEPIAAGSGQRWPACAACQLWLLHLRHNRPAEAETVYESLAARYRFERLAMLVPQRDRGSILQSYLQKGVGLRLLAYTPGRIRDLERAIGITRLLGEDQSYPQTWAALALFRAYCAAGQYDRAFELAEEGLRSRHPWERRLCEEYAWLLRLRGRYQDARTALDRFLLKEGGTHDAACLCLLVERARLHAAMGNWDAAAKDIEEYFRLSSPGDYYYYSAACLIEGFLCERRGNRAGAVEAWRRGFLRDETGQAVGPQGTKGKRTFAAEALSGVRFLHFMILGSLADELSEAETEDLIKALAKRESADSPFSILRVLPLPASVYEALRTMWRTPRGRELARKVAFREMDFGEYARQPLLLAACQFFKQGAMGEDIPREQEELLWQLAGDGHSAHLSGKLSVLHMAQLGLAWKGRTDLFGWAGVAPALDASLRRRLSYVLGHRYLRLKRPEDAADFFSAAAAAAQHDSVVYRLARQQLGKLQATTRPK